MLSFEEEVDALADAGLLTERQAEAFVHRRIELTPRWAAAQDMGIAEDTLDDYVEVASEKIETAHATVEALGRVRYQAGELPEERKDSSRDSDNNGGD
jgi:predicted DNA-binding protein (UPF0251 family)